MKIDYSAGFVITDVQSHEKGTICRTPKATTHNCECPNPKWYTDRNGPNEFPHERLECAGDANDQPKEIKRRLVMRPNKHYEQ